jgi:hypothetical protein
LPDAGCSCGTTLSPTDWSIGSIVYSQIGYDNFVSIVYHEMAANEVIKVRRVRKQRSGE